MTDNDRPAPLPYGMTVAEFCVKYRCSRSGYAKAKKQRRGPDEITIFGKQIITPEAEAQWLEAQQHRSRELAADRFAGGVHGLPLPPARSSTGKRLGRPPIGGWPVDPPPPQHVRKKMGRPTKAMVAARNTAGAMS